MATDAAEELSRRLAAYPANALSFFDAGFADAGRLSDDKRSAILDEMINNLKRGSRRISGTALKPITGLTERESEQIASVYSVVIGLLAESTVTPDEFVERATGILFQQEQAGTASSIAIAICAHRPAVSGIVDRVQLANEVLPSFLSLDVAVDIRLRFIEGQVKTTVPIALLHIATDIDGKDLYAQFTGADLEQVIWQLNTCLTDLKTAEQFRLSNG